MGIRRHCYPRSFCKGGVSANPHFLLSHSSRLHSERTTKSPPPSAPCRYHWPVTLATWQWQEGLDQNLIYFSCPSVWSMSWKMKDTMQVYKTHNQVTADPNLHHLTAGANRPVHAILTLSRGAQLGNIPSFLEFLSPQSSPQTRSSKSKQIQQHNSSWHESNSLGDRGLLQKQYLKRRHT